MISTAYAMAQSPTATSPNGAASPPSILQSPMIPMVGLFIILYFMMIRPQKKRETELKKFLSGLKKGDEVITSTGLYGKVAGVTDLVITLEIANGVKVRVSRSSIAGLQPTQSSPAQAEVVNG